VSARPHGVVRYEIEADELTVNGADADGLGAGLYLTAEATQREEEP
jgi:hypothetical protein